MGWQVEFGLLGEHLGHSFSPAIHRQLGDYDYQLVELAPHEVEHFLKEGQFRGLNVTIPYKKTVLPLCHTLTPAAQRIDSVNTVVRQEDGTLLGDNTDYDGFAYLLKRAGAQVAGKKVVVLGSGGASLAVRAVLEDLGAGAVVTISRSGPDHYGNLSRHRDAAYVVNATPVGMYPNTGESPVDLEEFPNCEGVFDLIYNPAQTRILWEAAQRGLSTQNGLGMLVAQAKAAAQRFLSCTIPDQKVEEITQNMERESKNLLLIGMPGCGKSTVGRLAAQAMGRPFVDLDAQIEAHAGQTIPQIFAQQGEEAFRRLEHEALRQVSKGTGQVISCGGGIVTRRENWPHLEENSTVIYLKRPLECLSTQGRPLSQSHTLEELYRQRAPLYEQLAHWTVDNHTTPQQAVEQILTRWKG